MVLHHLHDVAATARECYRVLRQNGVLCVRNTTSDAGLVHQKFFPAVSDAVKQKLLARNDLTDVFQEVGFTLISHQIVPQEMAASWREYAEKIAARADSFIAPLSEGEFEEGMRKLHEFAAQIDPAQPVIQEIDFFAFRK